MNQFLHKNITKKMESYQANNLTEQHDVAIDIPDDDSDDKCCCYEQWSKFVWVLA